MEQGQILYHHRSKERIKDLGEVFTPEKFVKEMLNSLSSESEQALFWSDEDNIFFEPTCGHGNFVTEILQRRLPALYSKAKSKKIARPELYAIANAINTIWAIDIDRKNIEECRFRTLTVIMKFWTLVTDSTYTQVIRQNKTFFTHLICSVLWHVHENEALSALSDENKASISASQTSLGKKWLDHNKHRPIDFDLSWCGYFQECQKQKIKPLEYARSASFLDAYLNSGKVKGYEEISFVLEVLTYKERRTA